MLGAQAFVGNYPALGGIKVVLNFEMRGDYGPSMMFQASDNDTWLVRQFAAAAPYPRASSLAPEAYKRMPNDTDLTVFMAAGLAGARTTAYVLFIFCARARRPVLEQHDGEPRAREREQGIADGRHRTAVDEDGLRRRDGGPAGGQTACEHPRPEYAVAAAHSARR